MDKASSSSVFNLNTVILLALLCLMGILVIAIGFFACNFANSLAAPHPTGVPAVHSPTARPAYTVPSIPIYPTTAGPQKFYIDRNFSIAPGHFTYLDYQLPAGVSYSVSASTDGAPIDVLVLDEKNYNKYDSAGGHDDGNWQSLAMRTAVIDGSFTFTTTKEEKYYFIWSNVRAGELAGHAVNVYVRVAE